MALNKKQDAHGNAPEQSTTNVRQLPSQHQNQILSALDTLGAKLVRSETEREMMKRLLNEALDAQERLENQLERSHIDIQNRMDKLDNNSGSGLDADSLALLEDHTKTIAASKETIADYNDRQIRVEDKLRDSLQTIAKLQRRIDSQEQKRAKLQRRIERVENIASDAQNALESKALVLLTDQSTSYRALPNLDASAPMAAINHLHDNVLDQPTQKSKKTPSIWLAACLALAVGWGLATYLGTTNKTLMMMPDGTLTQIDMKTGVAKPITFEPAPQSSNEVQPTPVTGQSIEDDLALFASDFSTDWVTQDILDQALNPMPDESAPATETTPEITIDRDPTLPAEIKPIEGKAMNGIAEAQHDLAALYTAGQAGVTQNYERAVYWFKMAAAQGIANAAYNLGVLAHQGLGQAQDMDRALDWYRRAAQLGHPEAQYNLGIAYIEGIGTRYNPNMAAAFFQQAALGGIAEAAYNLGLILENGLLGEVRPDDALLWYRGAAEKGSVEAEQALNALAARLNIAESNAGYLSNGGTVASLMDSNAPATQETADAADEMSLGALVPTRQQILVAQIQEQLRKIGYYNGPQDGVVGADTVKSIKSYQIREELEANGQATDALLSHMLSNGNI